MIIITVLLGVLLGSALTIFALENSAIITVSAFAWHFSSPLAFLLLGVAAIGGVIALLALLPAVVKADKRAATLEKEKLALEHELSKYRIVIPVAPPSQTMSPIHVQPREREMVLPR